jgi:signal transduction histidine kinase/CheY-like chemotaxis protein
MFKVKTKLRFILTLYTCLPIILIMLMVGSTDVFYDEAFQSAMVLGITLAILLPIFSPHIIGFKWLFLGQLNQIFDICQLIRKGDYNYFQLPNETNEPENENEIQRLMRNMNWMIRQIELREEKLKEAAKNSETANIQKSRFLANMSHEIRTPMNAVIGLSHLCLDTQLADEQRDYLEKIYDASHLLLNIIDDILDFSKIEAGKLELESVPFCLDEVLENLRNMIAMKAHEKGLELVFDISPGTPVNLIGDPLRLGQVLLNLTSNAVKFTEKGEIVVTIYTNNNARDQSIELQISVKDTGIGIPADQLPTLFDAFTQVDSSSTRKSGGSGLGLAISKHLIKLMGGKITSQSKPGQGSLFNCFVVLKPNFSCVQRHLSITSSNQKILVVEDNISTRQMLFDTLTSFSFRPVCVESGALAVKALGKKSGDNIFRLILIDSCMPGMDGIETIKQIQLLPGIPKLPTILMTPIHKKKEIILTSNELNIDGFLEKPFTPSTLLDTVRSVFAGANDLEKNRCMERQWAIEPQQALTGARILLVEDNVINQRVAENFLIKAGINVTLANNGREAVEIYDKNDFDCILMDIQMPEMDGFEATKAILKSSKDTHPPIIAMTANAMPEDKEKCMEAGMVAHIPKPVKPQYLFDVLQKWVVR